MVLIQPKDGGNQILGFVFLVVKKGWQDRLHSGPGVERKIPTLFRELVEPEAQNLIVLFPSQYECELARGLKSESRAGTQLNAQANRAGERTIRQFSEPRKIIARLHSRL